MFVSAYSVRNFYVFTCCAKDLNCVHFLLIVYMLHMFTCGLEGKLSTETPCIVSLVRRIVADGQAPLVPHPRNRRSDT